MCCGSVVIKQSHQADHNAGADERDTDAAKVNSRSSGTIQKQVPTPPANHGADYTEQHGTKKA